MKSETYDLPIHWASYFVNGDASGLEDSDQESADLWWQATFKDKPVSCVGIDQDEWFAKYHDAHRYCLACTVSTFTFLLP